MAADVYDIRMYFSDGVGRRSQMVTHWEFGTGGSPADPFAGANAMMTQYQAAIQATMLGCVSADMTLDVYSSRRVNNGGGPTNTLIVGTAGGATGTLFSNAVAFNIAMVPGAPPYLRKTGHMYLPGVNETDVVQDVIQAGAISAIGFFTVNLAAGFMVGGIQVNQVIWDRTTQVAVAVGDYVLRPRISPLRRRIRPALI